MIIYPYSAPIILTDTIFTSYGGHPGNSAPAQRTAAYLIAEMATTEDLDTFLLPTIVTGTWTVSPVHRLFMLDYGHIQQVYLTRFLDEEGTVYWSQTGTNNFYVQLRDDTYGLMDISYMIANCHCSSSTHPFPYQIQIAYQAGFPTGTATKPDILLAMVTYADLILQEIIGYGNEAPGDVGVQSFDNQDYSETRVKLLRTSFGTSARANFAHQLLDKYRKRRWVGLGL